jgi:hypothetical protein
MRYKDAIVTGIALVLSLSTLTGLSYTEQFQQAARYEVGGFDALAHDLFHASTLASADSTGSADSTLDHGASKQ